MDTSASVKLVNDVPLEKVPLMKAVTSKVYSLELKEDATVIAPDCCPMEK